MVSYDFVIDSRWLDREDLSPSLIGHRHAINQLICKVIWNLASDATMIFAIRNDNSFYFGTRMNRQLPIVLGNPCEVGVSDPGREVSLMEFYKFWRNTTETLYTFNVIPALILRQFFKHRSFRGHRAFIDALCENENIL